MVAFRRPAALVLLVLCLTAGLTLAIAPAQPAYALCPGSMCRPEGALLLAEFADGATGERRPLTSAGGQAVSGRSTPVRTVSGSAGMKVRPKGGGRWGVVAGLAAGVMTWAGLQDNEVQVPDDYVPPAVDLVPGWQEGVNQWRSYRHNPAESWVEMRVDVVEMLDYGAPAGVSPLAVVDVTAVAGYFSGSGTHSFAFALKVHCRDPATGQMTSSSLGTNFFNINSKGLLAPTSQRVQVNVKSGCHAGVQVDHLTVHSNSSAQPNVHFGSYYPQGHPDRPAAGAAEPGRVDTTVTCRRADGSELTVTGSVEGVVLTAGSVVGLADAVCPPGTVAVGARSGWIGSTTGTEVELIPQTEAPSWVQAVPADYPECIDGECLLQLQEVLPDGSTRDCLVEGSWSVACTGWASQPDRDTRYRCAWGTYAVELSRCAPYKREGTGQPRVPTADEAGNPLPGPPLDTPDREVERSACFPTGWGVFNPVEWVQRPVQCALSWAFVPTPGLAEAGHAQVVDAWAGTALGTAGGVIPQLAAVPMPSAGGCGVILDRQVPALLGGRMVVSTCTQWWTGVGGPLRVLLGTALVLGTGWGVLRGLLRMLRVDMGGDLSGTWSWSGGAGDYSWKVSSAEARKRGDSGDH